jgi:hypothetical protein
LVFSGHHEVGPKAVLNVSARRQLAVMRVRSLLAKHDRPWGQARGATLPVGACAAIVIVISAAVTIPALVPAAVRRRRRRRRTRGNERVGTGIAKQIVFAIAVLWVKSPTSRAGLCRISGSRGIQGAWSSVVLRRRGVVFLVARQRRW